MRSYLNREFAAGRKYGLCVFLFFCLFVTRAQGAEYYAAPAGNDANDGSIDHPWQHIGYGTGSSGNNPHKLQAGDTLYLRAGTYKEYSIDFKNSGTDKMPITVKCRQNETAIVDGSDGNASSVPVTMGVFDFGFFYSPSYIVLDGLTVQNGFDNNINIGYSHAAGHITIKNCTITGHRYFSGSNCGGIHCNRSFSAVIIDKCRIAGDDTDSQNYSGVHLIHGNGDVTVSNCEISHCRNGICYKLHQTQPSTTGGKPIFKNNFIYSCNDGIDLNNDNCTAENNLVIGKGGSSSDYNGIFIYGGGDPTGYHCVISHNTVYNFHCTMGINCGTGLLTGGINSAGYYGATANTVIDNVLYGANEELATFHIWRYAKAPHLNHAEHATVSDYNCYYNSAGTDQICEFANKYDLSKWQALYPDMDKHSAQGNPIFANGSGTLTKLTDFILAGNSPGKGKASNGMDMGADISSVGINGTVTTATTAAFPSYRLVVYPNPARIPKGSGKTVKLTNLDANLEVDIYNSFGERVRTLADNQTVKEWDAKTDTGEEAAMGTYFAVSGSKRNKIALIR